MDYENNEYYEYDFDLIDDSDNDLQLGVRGINDDCVFQLYNQSRPKPHLKIEDRLYNQSKNKHS